MPNEKANTEVEKIQYLNRHCIQMKIARRQKAKVCQADQRATSLASRFHFSKSKSCSGVRLSGGAKRSLSYYTSARLSAKERNKHIKYLGFFIFIILKIFICLLQVLSRYVIIKLLQIMVIF